MKTKKLLLIIALFLVTILSLKSNSDEVKFKASNMDIKNDGNLVIAYKSSTLIPNKEEKEKYEKPIDQLVNYGYWTTPEFFPGMYIQDFC